MQPTGTSAVAGAHGAALTSEEGGGEMICKSCENPILKSEKYFRPPHGGYRHEDCTPAKMRRRIEVLEEENFRLIAEVDRDTGLCAAAADRIAELEAELAKMNESGEVLHAKYRELEAELAAAVEVGKASTKCLHEEEQDNSRLRACLKRYGEHFRSCPAYSNMPKEPCTCGLAAELKEGE